MQYDHNGTMMSQRYVQWYDIPKAGYEGSDCKSNMSDRAQDDNIQINVSACRNET
jgi:hypothetical protein